MKERKYPRIGNKQKYGRRCKFCTLPAGYRVEVQVSIFRGDDEVFWLCPGHANEDAERLIERNNELLRGRFKP